LLDTGRHTVSVKGNPVELTKREFDLLHYLLKNKGIVITREVLLENVWGFDFAGDTNAVDVYVRYIRGKIDDTFNIRLIHTVRGVGYVIKDE
jgi:DNA-binding response OmpR family regulator